MKKKTVALLLALVLCVGCAIGGTVAWLADSTETIVNTFTDSDINIELTETGVANNANSYQMIPGGKITKDPKVTVKAGSEACWLFVKLDENLGSWSSFKVDGADPKFIDYIHYNMADGWLQLTDVAGVYYRKVEADDDKQEFYVLEGDNNQENQLTIDGSVTKAMMDAIDGISNTNPTEADENEKMPTLSVTAYAIQSANLDYSGETDSVKQAAIAWALANDVANP